MWANHSHVLCPSVVTVLSWFLNVSCWMQKNKTTLFIRINVVGNHKLLTILKLLNTWIIIGSITFSLLLTNHITAHYKISPPIASINLLSPSCFQLHIPCFFYSPYLCLHFRTHIIAFPISCSLSSFSLFPKLDKLFLYFFLFVNSSLILTEIIANMFKLW